MTDVDTTEEPAADGSATTAFGPTRRRLTGGQRWLVVIAVGAAVVSTGGLVVSAFVKSPAQLAADTAPPARTVLTATATMRTLSTDIVARGLVYPAVQYNVAPPPASGDVSQLIVSKLPRPVGSRVNAGDLLAEVSGQPMFALAGAVPMYRSLKPGDTGPDVAELQAALAGLGYGAHGDASGTFGAGTKAAVAAFFTQRGYPVPTTGAATQHAVDAANAAVATDRAAISGATSATALGTARQQLDTDTRALAAAVAANGPMVPVGEFVFLPSFPASVTTVDGVVGSAVSGALLGITIGQLALTAELPPAEATGIRPGMHVTIDAEAQGTSVPGTVGAVGTATTTAPTGQVVAVGSASGEKSGAGGGGGVGGNNGGGVGGNNNGQGTTAYVPVQITPTQPLPQSLNGANVRISIATAGTSGPVLAVPVAAVFSDAKGQTEVSRVDADGGQVTVPVTTGLSGDGFVQVTPLGGTPLRPGDRVVVGS